VDEMLSTSWKLFDKHFKPAEVGIKKDLVEKYWPKDN
jgi:V/A-type H+-transporting ATPase subunit B